MKTLNLKKIAAGYYQNKVDDIEITVSKFNSKWQLTVSDWSKPSDQFMLLNTWFDSKREAYYFGANWLLTEFELNA